MAVSSKDCDGPLRTGSGGEAQEKVMQNRINKLIEVMERAQDPDCKEFWKRIIDYFYVKHVEESVRKEGLK
jgi:hypothetical protein